MIEGPNGVMMGVPMHYTPPPPPPANDVSAAKTALQQHLGNNAPDDSAALAAAIKKIQEENAAISADALARAAILLQEQYDAAHHQPQDANVDPIKEAESQVGLTHQFDQGTLDAATKSLMDSPLATAPASTPNAAPSVSLADARTAIQTGLNNGLTWQEAVNAARVQFGGLAQNETVLDEAAITVKGDALVSGSDASGGNVLNDAAKQIAGLHLFADANNGAAVAALKVTLKPSAALANDAKQADSAWATLQQDKRDNAGKLQIAMDLQNYHSALSKELDDAAGKPPSEATSAYGTANWAGDPLQSARLWQAEQTVIAANTAAGLHGPGAGELLTALKASEILDRAQAVRASNGPNSNAPANLKAAQFLTQQLAGLNPKDDLSQQVMGDLRTQALHDAALADITGAHGKDAQSTLVAEGQALSGYRNTVLFASLVHDTLGSATTQHNLQAVGTPGKLTDIANLLDPLAKASPELAQALFARLQDKIVALIKNGPEYMNTGMETPQQLDSYYGPLARIVEDAGGPKSAQAQPVVSALNSELQQLQSMMTREQQAGQYSTENPFQPLAYLRNPQLNDPMSLYQTLIDQDPNSDLGKTLSKYTGLKAQAAPATPASDGAGTLSTAQTALSQQLHDPNADAATLQKALAAARKANPTISDKTWAEAVIAWQAQNHDAAAIASGKAKAPGDLVAQASGEVGADQLFDAATLDAATRALQGGQIADGGMTPKTSVSSEAGQPPTAVQYMQGLVSNGMTMPEAIALTRAWLSGSAPSAQPDLVLTQAALTVRAQWAPNLKAYYDDPNGTDPIALAAGQLKDMKVLDPATIDLAVNGAPASGDTPAVVGMKQDPKPDLNALNGKDGKPGLVEQVNSAYTAWQSAQTKADKKGSTAADQQAAATALQKYHAAVSSALNAAAGRAPNDSSWQSNPVYFDTLLKSQNQLEVTALAPQIQAAQYGGKDSPEYKALDAAFKQWQAGLDALRIVGTVQYAQQLGTPSGADPSAGDVTAVKALSYETYGLEQADPQLYRQVMGDAYVTGLEHSALTSITSAAAAPMMCMTNGADETSAKARLHDEGVKLQAYAGTALYAQLLDGVAKDPATLQLFSTIHASVFGQKSDADKLKTLADMIGGTNPDLAALLVNKLFQTGGRNSTFSPAQLVAWTKSANDMTQVSTIYAAAGGARNADMTALRKQLETMVVGDENFGKVGYSSRLNTQVIANEGGAVVWGEDLGLGDVKKKGDVPMQLAQDMIDDDPTSDLGVEIKRETGFPTLGKPAAPVAVTDAKATLADDASYVPGAGTVVTAGHHLAGLPWQDGMQTATSYDQLLNLAGEESGLKADYAPATLADEQALAYGQFALYNPNDQVFDAKGHKTTLGQMVQSLMKGEGVTTPDGLSPVTIASLSGSWWDTRTPTNDDKRTDFTLFEGIGADGGLIDVGPADTTVRHGYADWQSHTGFHKGYMLAQPHWVVDANGTVQTGKGYFVDYKPDDHWYDWDHVKADLEMTAMVVGGVMAMIALPEGAPLWAVMLSEAADAGFALSAAVGTVGALKKLSAPGGTHDWVNWLDLAANAFGGAASGLGLLARSGKMVDRLATSAPAFQDAARVTAAAHDATPLEFARAEVEAALNGGRAVRMFDDTRLARLLRRPLVASDGTVQLTVDLTRSLRTLQETKAFGLTGLAAMVTNATSMLQQGYALTQAGGQASMQDWVNLFLSAGLMASGVGVERIRAGDPRVAAARRTAVNEVLPSGVRLLASGDVEVSPAGFEALDDAGAARVAQLTGRGGIASVSGAAQILRASGWLGGQDEGAATSGDTRAALTADEVKQLDEMLPSGMRVTRDGTLILGEPKKGRDGVAQAAALVTALQVLIARQRSRDAAPADGTARGADVQADPLAFALSASIALDAPASATDYQQMTDRMTVLRDFWERAASALEQIRRDGGVVSDTWADTLDEGSAQDAWQQLPTQWRLHDPASLRALIDGTTSGEPITGVQLDTLDRMTRTARLLLKMALLDVADVHRALAGGMTPFEIYALLRALYEQRFNGSRSGNTFGIDHEPGLGPVTAQRGLRRGDVPYWDLTDAQINASGARLAVYGDAGDSPLRTPDGRIRIRLHYAEEQDLQRMTDAFGPPSGTEPALMTSSLRTLQIETDGGWQQMKFSMPERNEFGYGDGDKTLSPDKVQAAVQANDAAQSVPGLAAEPAGLSLDLGDGSRPITQLWRPMSVAERGYEPGDFVAPLHVLTSPEFAATPLGERFFGTGAANAGEGLSPQRQWLVNEVAPRLGDALVRMITGLAVHPMLHEQNVEVIVGADGHVADVIVKDMSDLKLDPRGMAVFDGASAWSAHGASAAGSGASVLAYLYEPAANDTARAQFERVAQFYDETLAQIGGTFGQPSKPGGNPLLDAVAKHVVDAMRRTIPGDWLAARASWGAHEIALDASGNWRASWRIAAARELLLQYAEHPATSTGDDGAGPANSAGAAQARVTPLVSTADTSTGRPQQAVGGVDAGSLAPVDPVMRDAGSRGRQNTRSESGSAAEEMDGARVPGDPKAVRAVPDQQSRGTGRQAQQNAQEEEVPVQGNGVGKGAAPAARGRAAAAPAQEPHAVEGAGKAVPKAGAEPSDESAGENVANVANGAGARKPANIEPQKITRYDVANAIRVIKARFGNLIMPSREPNPEQVALLEPEKFAQARAQAEQEGRGSFDENVTGFTVIDGTMEIDGRQVRVVLPSCIAPENVTASSPLMHDMLHFAQSPEFIAWSRELNARLNADAQVKANGWFGIDTHEGLTELFNVKINGGAGAPGEDNTSFAEHVYESYRQGYQAILYALDGAVNEEVVQRIGESVAARAFFQADPAAMRAYENAMFDVYRNTPDALVALRKFVLDKMGAARSGEVDDAAGTPPAGAEADLPDGRPAPADAKAKADAEASSLLARLREKAAEVAYARLGRWNHDGDSNQGGAPDSMAARAMRRITERLSDLTSKRAQREADSEPVSFEPGSDVDNLNAAMDKRGLSNFYLLEGAVRAAKALRDKSHIVLVTGFSVDLDAHGQPMPETDGPPGTAYLASTIKALGERRVGNGGKPIRVTVVTDSPNQPVMRAALDAINARNVKIEVFDAPYGPAAEDGTRYDSGARPSAAQLLDRLRPDAVVAVELPAHTSVDGPINMRGVSVKGFNSARDALVEVANERGIETIGVGDGGNEAGVVQKQLDPWVQQNIPTVKLPDGTELEFRSAVPVDHAVTSWNSSFGAQTIGVAMLKLENLLDLAPDGAAYAAVIEACAQAGAYDGVTRRQEASVDGFSASLHSAFTDALIEAARDDHGVFLPNRPTIVVVFDSSNGALVAHQELEAEISAKTGRAVQFVYVVDHGNAPYGQYSDRLDTLANLVRHALQTGDEIPSAEMIVMACNTAHGPHYEGLMDLDAMGRPVINLIETTAVMMLEEGGEHPALFATATTVGTHMYRDQVREKSGGTISVQEVAAPNWADFVNDMKHASTERSVRAEVQRDVNEIVGQLDENTTSVWLCCTHYPALEAQIRTALDARGMNDVQIFNPMTEQGDVARAAIGWEALPEGVAPLVRNPAPIVLTTGDAAAVEADARELTGYDGVRAIHLEQFGSGTDMTPVLDALAWTKLNKISRALATQWSAGGKLHHGSQTNIFVPDGAENAANALDPSKVTMIIVGAEEGAVDGVTGASVLGGSFSRVKANDVYVVPDQKTARSVRLAHAAAGIGEPNIEVFAPGDDARAAADVLLERVSPASVVAVKVYGRNADGLYHTSSGESIDAVPMDEILLAANERDLDTVGIGDAPVYAGLHTAGEGPWYEVQPTPAAGGRPMVNPGSVVVSKFPVTGPTAAVASDGLLGALVAAGRLDVLLTPDQFGAVISVGRDRYSGTKPASRASDQHLSGLRGRMTEALHEILLSVAEPPPEPSPAQSGGTPQDGGDTSGAEAQPGEVAYARLGRWQRGDGDDGASSSGGAGEGSRASETSSAAGAPDPAEAAAAAATAAPAPAAEPEQLVAGAQWETLLERLNRGELRASANAYVYLVQSSHDPSAPDAPGGIAGTLVGWGVFGQGAKRGRWLGQSQPGGAPGRRISDSPLDPSRMNDDLYVVISRRPPAEVGTSGHFADAQWTADPAAIAWPDVPAPVSESASEPAGGTGEAAQSAGTSAAKPAAAGTAKAKPAVGKPSSTKPAARASKGAAASNGAATSKTSKASPAAKAAKAAKGSSAASSAAGASGAAAAQQSASSGSGRPMRWTRIGATFGGAAGTGAALVDAAGGLALPAATASLCFIYRGSVVALRTRLGTLISRHVAGAAGTDPQSHLDWIERWLVNRGAAWGINRSVRSDYASAIDTLRDPASTDDARTHALAVLGEAPKQLYMPHTVLGNVNDVLQAATLAANVSINGTYVLEKGTSAGVVPLLTNLGFGLSNSVLITKNLADRLKVPLRTAKERATLKLQSAAQATVMTGYTLSTIPWVLSDFETGTAVGFVKGGLDIVFGMGSGGQAFNDTRAIASGGRARPIRIARVHPLMFLGAGAVARFVLQLFTMPSAPAVQPQGNGQQQGQQPGSGQQPNPGPGSGKHGSGSQNGNPGGKHGGGNNHGKPGSGTSPGDHNKPTVIDVKKGDSLWRISETHLKQILSASELARLAPEGQDAETAAALHQLLQLNPKFDEDPDLIFAGQTVVLNKGS